MNRIPLPGPNRSRRALTSVAVAVALTVTVGPLALASPAGAQPAGPAPTAATQAAEARAAALKAARATTAVAERPGRNENLPKIPKHSRVLSAGQTGYLVQSGYDPATQKYTASWVRTADGSVTPVKQYSAQQLDDVGSASDVLVLPGDATRQQVTLTDLSGGAPGAKTVIDLPTGFTYRGLADSAVVASDGTRILLIGKVGGVQTEREVTGLPAGRNVVRVDAAGFGGLVVRITGEQIAFVDLELGSVTGLHTVSSSKYYAPLSVALSASHLAWLETPEAPGAQSALVVVERASGNEIRRTAVPPAGAPLVALAGDQVLYGTAYDRYDSPNPAKVAINAVPVGGGTPVKVFDRAHAIHPAADGSALVTGGTLDRDEGVYRVTDTAAAPAVEKIATTGETTRISFEKSKVPAEVNLDTGETALSWELSRHAADYLLTLEQPSTGTKYLVAVGQGGGDLDSPPHFLWDGLIGDGDDRRYAPSGAYKWTLTAKPWDGIGPAATATGTIDVKRTRAPHDWTNNGSPDLLATDGAGRLWREDTYPWWVGEAQTLKGTARQQVGTGWEKYDRIESIGVQQGRTALLARDAAGDVWLHHDNGFGTPLAQGVKVGWGWQTYTRFTGGPSVYGVDTKGDLYFHPATNTQPTAFGPRKKAGWGWGIYNEVTSVGDIAGNGYADLVARDTAGVLWLYQGRWDGSFDARVRIGGGWNEYTRLVGIGDANRDGRADLYAYGPNGRTYFYAGTGQAAAPFKPRTAATVLNTNSSDYKIVF
ncbi:FG-GAP-like repeat-containing protein [Streptomyces sp. NPDC006798]|uniref:FG-GAP-like repeat-containing protein n=1 Tax=Streptomyces sp. NPDC006798 TaxID=3155462 RepID=UPI0033EB2727